MEFIILMIIMVVAASLWSLHIYRKVIIARTTMAFERALPGKDRYKLYYEIRREGLNEVVSYDVAFKYVYKLIYWSNRVSISFKNNVVLVRKDTQKYMGYGNDA